MISKVKQALSKLMSHVGIEEVEQLIHIGIELYHFLKLLWELFIS